jgi:hypothetical protein
LAFHAKLTASLSDFPVPSDLVLPDTELSDLVVSMTQESKLFLGSLALDQLRSQMRWQRSASHLDKLEEEIARGHSCLVWDADGGIERLTDVIVLQVESLDGRLLVQLGQSVEECTAPLVPLCRLPCSNDSGKPLLTARRLIDDQLAPYAKSLSLSEPENSVYWDTSPEYRIRTKYAKSVFRLVLDRPVEHRPGALNAEARTRPPGLALPDQLDMFAIPYDFVNGGRGFFLCAWLDPDCFEKLSGQVCTTAGDREFRHWLSSVSVEPLHFI